MASNPDIPSFKNPDPKEGERKEDEKKGSGMPALGQAGGKPALAGKGGGFPALKVRGLGGGPKTLVERLKQFQKKDLIFIASGLGVLFMAPLAEHFLMTPTSEKSLQPGFSSPGGGLFGGEVGVHEPGAGGMSPGGLVGSNGDIITPLNVRDPSALIMGPGSTEVKPSPAAASVTPPSTPSSQDRGGWKDALSAAKSGASQGAAAARNSAFKAAGQLSSALRGLSALSGGSYGGGPSYSLGAPNASNVPNKPGAASHLSRVQATPGYSGVGRGLDAGGGAEGAKAAAEKAAGLFNRPGGAANNLEAAAKEAIPGGNSGGAKGGPGGGGDNKNPGGNSGKDNKSLGENLAYLKAKMEMEKELDLKWSRKKWKEFEFPKMIYEELTKSAIQNMVGEGMFKPFARSMSQMWAAATTGGSGVQCWVDGQKLGDEPAVRMMNDEKYFYKVAPGGKFYLQCEQDRPTGCTPQYDRMANFYQVCTLIGGGGPDDKNGQASGPDGQEPQSLPGVGNPKESADKLRRFLEDNHCSSPARSVDQWVCDAVANQLIPVYETNLTQAQGSAQEAADRLKDAWFGMKGGADLMYDLINGDQAKSGSGGLTKAAASFGGGEKPAEVNVLDKAKAASDKLKEVESAPDPKTAKDLLQAAAELLSGKAGAEGAEAQPGAKQAYESAVKDLQTADQKRPEVVKQIQAAEQAIEAGATAVAAGADTLTKAEQVLTQVEATANQHPGKGAMAIIGDATGAQPGLVKPIRNDIQALRGLLAELGGQQLASGQGAGAKAAPGGKLGDAQQTLDKQVTAEGEARTCGDCSKDGGAYGAAVAAQTGSMQAIASLNVTPDVQQQTLDQLKTFASTQKQALDVQIQAAAGSAQAAGQQGAPTSGASGQLPAMHQAIAAASEVLSGKEGGAGLLDYVSRKYAEVSAPAQPSAPSPAGGAPGVVPTGAPGPTIGANPAQNP